MARRVRIRWIPGVFANIRTLPQVQARIAAIAESMAMEANSGQSQGYVAEHGITGGRIRARSAVLAVSYDARIDNAKHHTLVRILGGKAALVQYTSKAGRVSWITKKQYANYTRGRAA